MIDCGLGAYIAQSDYAKTKTIEMLVTELSNLRDQIYYMKTELETIATGNYGEASIIANNTLVGVDLIREDIK